MEYSIPKIPTAEEIAAMSPEEKQAAALALETALLREAEMFRTLEAERIQKQTAFDEAYAAFQDANKALIESLTEVRTDAHIARSYLQAAAVARRHLTGDKTWKAFQAAESWKPEYDTATMLKWALYDAPRFIREKLVLLNTKAADAFVLEQINEYGSPRPVEGAPDIPAIARRIYTGKILTKELEALSVSQPAPEAPTSIPVKMIEPVGPPLGNPSDWAALLTGDEVAAQIARASASFAQGESSSLDNLLAPTEAALVRLSETPTPVEPMKPVVVDNSDIPF